MVNMIELATIEKINLTAEETAQLSAYAGILEDSFAELATADTEGVTPLVTVLDLKNVLRDDIAAKMLSREELLSNAPEQYDGYFQVPKTLE